MKIPSKKGKDRRRALRQGDIIQYILTKKHFEILAPDLRMMDTNDDGLNQIPIDFNETNRSIKSQVYLIADLMASAANCYIKLIEGNENETGIIEYKVVKQR
jgi:hypothetical protein